MLTQRYRIVGLLGQGGMGEVYRADDLKLRQSVALKFLPQALVNDPRRLERFHNEVRVARQVSHPNVCRVYDIGEIDGEHFISMEYVDGEDLASVLRRMGPPSRDKAIQVARQICAGLAAAHDKGVLHRDLKPHNVMIDGRGKVRITDFGLAGFAEDFAAPGAEVGAGTPLYMAPEQLSGKEVTVRSDIYSLGLVLYKMFTGQAAFKADTREEVRRLRGEASVTHPSSIVEDIDPAVERVIMRCLENDPRQRPSSALAVAAALPGADPLAAALAAGETPSPEMVADAGEVGGLRPAIALPCLAGVVIGLVLTVMLSDRSCLLRKIPLDKPPAVLADRAQEILTRLGYTDKPQDRAYTFVKDSAALEHIAGTDDSVDRWDRLASGRPPVVYFWYRASPQEMVPESPTRAVAADDPPFVIPGMARLALDTLGRLLYFEAVPPRWEEAPPPEEDPDWSVLFAEAELDPADCTPATPAWTPQVYCDHRAAWTGAHPGRPESKLRIEAGAFRGRTVFFRLVEPWEGRLGSESRFGPQVQIPVGAAVVTAVILVLAACVYLAWRNYRSGRGDRRGALRLAFYILAAFMGADLFANHHVWAAREAELVLQALAENIMMGAFCVVFYLAIEPYARRYWPHSLITWSRLLHGRFRDPLVGREVLYGCLAGAWLSVIVILKDVVPIWMGESAPPSLGENLRIFLGGRYVVATILLSQFMVVIGVAFFAMLLLLRIVLRRPWLACGALFVFFVLAGTNAFTAPLWQCVVTLVWSAMVILVLVRWGLLAYLALVLVWALTWAFPTTFDFSAWYAGYALWGPLVALALATYGAWVSLAGRPLFDDESLPA